MNFVVTYANNSPLSSPNMLRHPAAAQESVPDVHHFISCPTGHYGSIREEGSLDGSRRSIHGVEMQLRVGRRDDSRPSGELKHGKGVYFVPEAR